MRVLGCHCLRIWSWKVEKVPTSEFSLFGSRLVTYEKKKLVVSAAINQVVQID